MSKKKIYIFLGLLIFSFTISLYLTFVVGKKLENVIIRYATVETERIANVILNDVITLDDHNDYVVVSKTVYQGKTYYLLVDTLHSHTMLCYEDQGELVENKDKDLNTKLLPYLVKESLRNMKS